MVRQSRQRPISCHFCRVRKLRCSRQFPCSNCTSRGVSCQQEPGHGGAPVGAAVALVAPVGSNNQPLASASPTSNVPTSEILARLEKLEALVTSQARELETARRPPFPTASTSSTKSAKTPSTVSPSAAPLPSGLERLTADAVWLERSSWNTPSISTLPIGEGIVFRTTKYGSIIRPTSLVLPNVSLSATVGSSEPLRCFWLPLREEAHILIGKHFTDFSSFHHITHEAQLRTDIDELYDSLDNQRPVDLPVVVLLLSVCANATYTSQPSDPVGQLRMEFNDTGAQAIDWAKATLDAADAMERSAQLGLQGIQGLMTVTFLICNMEGISHRTRMLVYRCIYMAREMCLHRLDDPNCPEARERLSGSPSRIEIGRRVFWYMASMDWMMGTFSNPAEGTYNIHRDHLATNKPRNIRDEDLVDGQIFIEQPADVPTNVTYLIERIKLGEILRDLVDRNPLSCPCPEGEEYSRVLEADAALNRYINEAPNFFAFEQSTTPTPNTSLFNLQIFLQRATLVLLHYRQICRIHLPYLARGAMDSAFAYSRETCIAAARTIIKCHKEVEVRLGDRLPMFHKTTMGLRSVFVCLVALLFDVCLDEQKSGAVTDSDLVDAFKVLYKARTISYDAEKLFDMSTQVLKRHGITLSGIQLVDQPLMSDTLSCNGGFPPTPDSGIDRIPVASQPLPYADAAFMDMPWQGLEQGRADLTTVDWDRFFWGVDAPLL